MFQVLVVQNNADMPVATEFVPNQQIALKTKLAVDCPSVAIPLNLCEMRHSVTKVCVFAMLDNARCQCVQSITWNHVPVLSILNFATCVASKMGCVLRRAGWLWYDTIIVILMNELKYFLQQ